METGVRETGNKAGQPQAGRRGWLLRIPGRRFGRDRSGSAAIEFSLLALPFFLLIFAVLESCIAFASQEVLANATDDVARFLRTGQIKAADMTETRLRKMICDRISYMVGSGCPYLEVDLKQYASFEDASKVRVKYTADKDIDTTGFGVTPGKSMSKNMLRVFYRWPVMTNFMASSLSNLKGNRTLHFASVTWQNEPFDD